MIGQTLSHFKIIAKLGEGGMGEVYRAEDSKLGREVAIKVLPEAVAEDPERLARFEREAKVLASLNHPQIAAIYSLESAQSDVGEPLVGSREGASPSPTKRVNFLVMELVEGDTLQELIEQGVPLEQSLEMAGQVAEALEAAHESGVVHRDLKPANVKVTPEGKVKVLDFGLAKALDPGAVTGTDQDRNQSPPALSLSPTLTAQMTQAGVILGTAAYMAPEQAKGKVVDKRADIWAFGCLLFEMLSGQRAFPGEDVTEILAAIIRADPDLDMLPSAAQPRLRRLIDRCLRKDPQQRLRDIGDARLALEEILAGDDASDITSVEDTNSLRARSWQGVVGLVSGLLLGATLAWLLLPRSADREPVASHLSIPMPSTLRVAQNPLITPDGRTVVFGAFDVGAEAEDHHVRLWLQRLDSGELVEIERSKGALYGAISPDGRWVAFTAPASELSSRFELLKVPLDLSTPPVKIADYPSADFWHLVWTPADRIFTIGDSGDSLLSWPADGGDAVSLPLESEIPISYGRLASIAPDGRHLFAFVGSFVSGAYRQDVGVVDTETGELRIVVEDGVWASVIPGGYLVFSRRDALMAAPIDSVTLELTAGPVAIMDGLWAEGPWTGGSFNVSSSGDLLYPAGGVQGVAHQLAVLDRQGGVTPWLQERLPFNTVTISPDGRRLASQVDNIAEGDALLQIRVSEVEDPRLVTVGSEPGRDCTRAAWSPDSQRLAYDCLGSDSNVLLVSDLGAGGPAQTLYQVEDPDHFRLIGFSAGGERLLLQQWRREGDRALVSVPASGGEASAEAEILEMEETAWAVGGISPDGRWLAYLSRQTGRRELFVREIVDGTRVGPKHLVAADIEFVVTWSREQERGTYEMLAIQHGRLVAIQMQTQPAVRILQPSDTGLDPVALGLRAASGLGEDRWMIVQNPDTTQGAADLRLVLNWTASLRQHLDSNDGS